MTRAKQSFRTIFFIVILLSAGTSGCIPAHHLDSTPEIFPALPKEIQGNSGGILILPVLHSYSTQETLVGNPEQRSRAILSQELNRVETGSWRLTTPFGALFGRRDLAEELCILTDDGKVVSLRRSIADGTASSIWREKVEGALIEPGRQYLLKVLEETPGKFTLPREVLSACSLDNRKARFEWAVVQRRKLQAFLERMGDL